VACRHTPPRVPMPLTWCESITDVAVLAPPLPPVFLCCPAQSPACSPGCTSVSAMKTEPSWGSWWPARCLTDSSSQQLRVPPARQQWPQRKVLQQAGGCWHELLLPVNQLGWCQDVSSGSARRGFLPFGCLNILGGLTQSQLLPDCDSCRQATLDAMCSYSRLTQVVRHGLGTGSS
jgi:hypothetical protein